MTLRTITWQRASFMKTKQSVHRLLDGNFNRVHHGAGYTAR
jgi:hypothetical protein